MFKRILIANRGEIATRIIRTCRTLGIETVAVYSTADKNSPHLREATGTVCIGPGQSHLSYLNREAILQAAINTECQAIHPGFGFLAEDFLFAAMCRQQKLTFIGPSSQTIRTMGNKSLAKKTVKEAGLRPIPGSGANLKDVKEAIKTAGKVGFPVLLKATSGGGGKGIRPCRDEDDLNTFYPQARMEAEKAFGDPSLYLEKMVADARHIEFQVIGDSYGEIIHLGERDCSIQRNNQKLIEESPSPAITAAQRLKMGKQIVNALKAIGYVNAGTIEFLKDREDNYYFMEMNTRLQVEHPVTEMITGIDIVQEQIKTAALHPLSFTQREITLTGHAIECRVNAEDPYRDFAPSPGTITSFEPDLSCGPGKLRVDTHVEAGYDIPPYYDSMICKVIAWGENRETAIQTMTNALKNFRISGIATTVPLHQEILASKQFRGGHYHNKSLSEIMGDQ